MTRKGLLIGTIALAAMMGCSSSKPEATTAIPPPPHVAAAPPLQLVPIDPKLRAQALALLSTATDDHQAFLRGMAIEALQEYAPDQAQASILRGLSDEDPGVRYAAALAAGRMRLQAANAKLLQLTDDNDARVEVGVRFALHRLGDKRLSHDLEKFAISVDPQVRACTAQVLGLLDEPSAAGILKKMTADTSMDVRLEASASLWRLGSVDARSDLVIDMLSTHPDDQIFAIIALAQRPDQQASHYIDGKLTSDWEEVSLAAARGLGMLGSDDGWNVAVPAAKNAEPRQRAMAALAMGAIGRPDLQHDLEPMLKDSDAGVRVSAATAILQLHSPVPVADR